MLVEISIHGFENRQLQLEYELDVTDEQFWGELVIEDTTVVISISDRKSIRGISEMRVAFELQREPESPDFEGAGEVTISDIYNWEEETVKVKLPRVPTFIGQPKTEEIEVEVKVKKLSVNLVETASE